MQMPQSWSQASWSGSLMNLNRTPVQSNPLKINIKNIARPYYNIHSEAITENRRQAGNMTPNHLYEYSETSQIVCHTPLNVSFEEIKEEENDKNGQIKDLLQVKAHNGDNANEHIEYSVEKETKFLNGNGINENREQQSFDQIVTQEIKSEKSERIFDSARPSEALCEKQSQRDQDKVSSKP